jgi:hypothetical protein
MLNIATEGNHSRTEHNVVFAVGLASIAYFLIAAAAERRATERSRAML